MRQVEKEIAVIGMSFHTAQTQSPAEWWEHLKAGHDLIAPIPQERRGDVEDYLSRTKQQQRPEQGAYLSRVDGFDYPFFDMTYKNALLTDPYQRLLLQAVCEAAQDAAVKLSTLRGTKTGLFVGCAGEQEYLKILEAYGLAHKPAAVMGNTPSIITGRVSRFLDLRGVNLLINAACSSSLLAVHQACRAIRDGSCEMAFAGGIQLHLIPIRRTRIGIEAEDARTKAFDASADGTGTGEGIGVVLLKPLSCALEQGDPIHAVIRGSCVNSDGSSIGLSAPNPAAQASVILGALEDAQVDPRSVTYLEAHGTGTKLGDPIEIEGITQALGRQEEAAYCAVGAVKTNIGHLDCAAGIAGLIKAILCLENGQIPPNLHYRTPNPMIDFSHAPVYINDRLRDWNPTGTRRCGVSAFSLNGANCHVVLEQAPQTGREQSAYRGQYPICLSAKTPTALAASARALLQVLTGPKQPRLCDVSYTLCCARDCYAIRAAFAASSLEECIVALNALARGEQPEGEEPAPLQALLQSYRAGQAVCFEPFFEGKGARRIFLPAYPFEPLRCWPQEAGQTQKGDDQLLEIFAASLGKLPDLSRSYLELGGDSIEAMEIVGTINDRRGTHLPVSALLQAQSLEAFLRLAQGSDQQPSMEKPVEKPFPLSCAQKRVFVSEQLQQADGAYHMCALLTWNRVIPPEQMRKALCRVMQQHRMLTTQLCLQEGHLMQQENPWVEPAFTWYEAQRFDRQIYEKMLKSPVSLFHAPLWRAILVQAEGKSILMTNLHHLIADGVSIGLLTRCLQAALAGHPLPEPGRSYREFVEEEEAYLSSDLCRVQGAFWKKRLSGLKVCRFPVETAQGGTARRVVLERELPQLNAPLCSFAQEQGISRFAVLFSAFVLAVGLYCHSEDVTVGLVSSGRESGRYHDTVGMFVRTLAVRKEICPGQSFKDFAVDTAGCLQEVYKNGEFPFERLPQLLGLPDQFRPDFLFDVLFNFHQARSDQLSREEPLVEALPSQGERFPIEMDVMQEGTRYRVLISFDASRYAVKGMEGFLRFFHRILKQGLSQPDRFLGEMRKKEGEHVD